MARDLPMGLTAPSPPRLMKRASLVLGQAKAGSSGYWCGQRCLGLCLPPTVRAVGSSSATQALHDPHRRSPDAAGEVGKWLSVPRKGKEANARLIELQRSDAGSVHCRLLILALTDSRRFPVAWWYVGICFEIR